MRFLPQFATVGLVCGVWHRDANGAEEKAASPPRELSGESCAEVDRGCVWALTWEDSLDALRTVPRAMRVEHLEAKCSGCRGGE